MKAIQKNLVEIPIGGRIDLRITGHELGNEGLTILFRSLPECRTLRTLSFIQCGIQGELVDLLSKIIVQIPHLEELNISENELQDHGVITIVNSASTHSFLSCLRINSVGCTDKGVEPILNWMKVTRKSLYLDLGRNTFSSTLIQKMIDIAKENVFVVGLILEGTGVTDDQMKELFEILIKNGSIASIIDSLIINACRRTFKSKLITFRESVKETRGAEDSDVESTAPAYKVNFIFEIFYFIFYRFFFDFILFLLIYFYYDFHF